MTVDAEAPDDANTTDLQHWRESDVDSLVTHFRELVTLWEMYEQFERSS